MVQKTIQDYYEQIFKEFPNIPKRDIKRILQFGWKQLYLLNSYGCDVSLQKGNFWIYFGKLMKDSLQHFIYYKTKLKTKLRILYKRNKVQWDGYYYFSLPQSQYDKYFSPDKRRGRPKSKFTFQNIVLRKIYEECLLEDINGVAIFKIPMVSDLGFEKFIPELTTNQVELVTLKKHTKMKDILTSNYDYKIIKNKKYKL